MKKMLFLALAVAGMLTACTSNDDLGANENNDLALQKIKLGVATNATVQTRGTGTVGGVKPEENKWNGQYFWVYMLQQGTMKVAQYTDPNGTSSSIYDNKLFVAPSDSASGFAYAEDNTVAYYPVTGNSDFWGYRIDDACGTATRPATVKLIDANGLETEDAAKAVKRVVDFTIDGSQDIMAGKAVLVAGDAEKLGDRKNDYYSAYASRHDVQPNISFDHQLTRFTFHVKAGSKGAAGNGDNTEAISVDTVRFGSFTKGQLTVAYTGAKPESLVTFVKPESYTTADMTKLYLRQRGASATQNANLVDLQKVVLTWNDDENKANVLPIGESLLVSPGEKTYPLTLDLVQRVVVSDDRAGNKKTEELKLQQNVTLPEIEGGYLAGHSYDVTITVYGLEKVVVTATLNPWMDGGNISIDDDGENVFKPAGK